MLKKNILIITELYPYPGNIYLGTFVKQQLEILKNYYNVTVLTVTPLSLKSKLLKKTPQLNRGDSGIKIVAVPYYPFFLTVLRLLQIPNSLVNYIKKLALRHRLAKIAQVLHAQNHYEFVHGHETFLGDEAGPIGRTLGIPSFFTLHSFYHYHEKIFGKFVTQLAYNNLRLCQHYFCVSTIAAESYIKVGLNRNKFSIIPNGVNITSNILKNKEICDFAKGRKVLLSVGWLVKEKRFDISIKVLSQLLHQPIVLVIAGVGPDKLKLQRLAISLKCSDRILWLDAVPPNSMPSVYEAIDILVHPSSIESFSMVCLEAMSHNKVVICTTSIGICEFTQSGKNILTVPPNNIQAFTLTIDEILQNATKYMTIAKNAYILSESMTWELQIEKIINIYHQFVK